MIDWSEEFVKEAWKEDKVKALKEAGIEGLLTGKFCSNNFEL